MHTISNMQLLLCNQYHSAKACSHCHAHTILNMQPLPCKQYRWAKACNCYHAYDTKHELLLCNQYHSARTYSYCHAYKTKHASVAMQPMSLKLNMQLLPCAQHHTCNCWHNCNSKFSWSNTCNFYKIKQNHRLFHHENLLIALLSIDRAWQFLDHKTDNESLKIQLESWITLITQDNTHSKYYYQTWWG